MAPEGVSYQWFDYYLNSPIYPIPWVSGGKKFISLTKAISVNVTVIIIIINLVPVESKI